MRPVVDLSAHINQSVNSGHPADFPVVLRSVFHGEDDSDVASVPNRVAIVREDTGDVLSVVSDRYSFISHQQILDTTDRAIASLDVGPVPRGIYVDRKGARMRALFKFPGLEQSVRGTDTICPCLKIQNTYDGTSRITVHIGAFRFVCTNLAVGGGGVFAGGFMAVHAGEIPLDRVAEQLTRYLGSFDQVVELYAAWSELNAPEESLSEILERLPARPAKLVRSRLRHVGSVYRAYNVATHVATHTMRSVNGAFELLGAINQEFQRAFPVS